MLRSDAIYAARNAAKKCGYALAVHGSEVRDLDLLAVPWIENPAFDADAVADRIREAVKGQFGLHLVTEKPHGRRAYVIWPKGHKKRFADSWYIDLSVMPRAAE
jgi:hypothetical protein